MVPIRDFIESLVYFSTSHKANKIVTGKLKFGYNLFQVRHLR